MRRTRIRRARLLAAAGIAALITTTASLSSAADQRYATIEPAKKRVAYGERLTLRGQFPDASNATVQVQHRRAAGKRFRTVTRTRTGPGGRFKVRVKPRATGVWRAQLANPQRAPAAPTDGGLADSGDAEQRSGDARTGSDRVVVRSRTRSRLGSKHVLAGRSVTVRGRVRPGGKRRVVVKGAGRTVKTRTDRRGRFKVRWTAPGTGRHRIKVRAKGNRRAAASRDRAGRVIAYRKAFASYYGPGFYGNRTACGQTLTRGMLGVAHKTMPCGTKLHLKHGSRTVKVKVIDRGPYAHGREFDLTEATKERLGFGSTGYVWTSR